jgi:uncharacterized protein
VKIAIVGSGISGLTVAYLLHKRHEITVFEASPCVGGHTHTVRVDMPDETHHVDTGFIVFNDRNYPNFERLLQGIGVAWQASEMSFSVSDGAGAFEYASGSPNGLFANRRHLATPAFHRMVADLQRFHRAARRLLEGDDNRVSLREWLEQQRFSRNFIERLIVPQVSAVWSADPHSLWSFPARFLAEFFANHGMLGFRSRPHWRAIRGGSARYVEALTAPFAHRIMLRAPVGAIERAEDHVLLTVQGADAMCFDHVVLATHSDQALSLLRDPSVREHEILSSIPYQANDVVLHTDARLLPRRRRAWASWNYHLLEEPAERPTVTYHMNRLQSLRSEREFCVTLNHTARIDPERVIKRIQYSHPVYTPDGVRAQSRVAEISGARRTHYCGAYWGWGFHEDGVNSALRVAADFGAEL